MPENNVYVSKNVTALDLATGEEVIFEAWPSLTLLILECIILGIIGYGLNRWVFVALKIAQSFGISSWFNLAPIVVVSIIAIGLIIQWFSIRFRLTNKRVEMSVRFLFGYDQNISVNHIESVKLIRSPLGFIFNYGTIVIKSAAANFEIRFQNIGNPNKFKELIEEHAG